MANINVTIRMDEDIKQAIRQQAIPFAIAWDVPNQETLEAIEEVQRLKNEPAKKTDSFNEILKELDSEI